MGTTAPLGEVGAGVQRGRIERFGLSLSLESFLIVEWWRDE
jgi:hypothetical protein